jgi:hypothetical protein
MLLEIWEYKHIIVGLLLVFLFFCLRLKSKSKKCHSCPKNKSCQSQLTSSKEEEFLQEKDKDNC